MFWGFAFQDRRIYVIDNQQRRESSYMKKPIIMVGLMGAGKTSIGQMLAEALGYDFIDSDDVIVTKEGRTIPNIFTQSGEPYFRDVERTVIGDLMQAVEPYVIGTGGGAFMNDETRALIKEKGISVFLKADLEVLLERVGDGEGRPLIEGDPAGKLKALMDSRYPIYSEADITVETLSEPVEQTMGRVKDALYNAYKLA